MAQFLTAFVRTGGYEGGYVNDKTDSGGETYKGIARNANPNWKGWKLIDMYKNSSANFPKVLETDKSLPSMVQSFYKEEYWDRVKGDSVKNQQLANELYDTAVNAGVSISGKILQRALNVLNQNGKYYPDLEIDGKIGNMTLDCVHKHPNISNVVKCVVILKGYHYITVSETYSKNEKYTNGWIDNRIDMIRIDK